MRTNGQQRDLSGNGVFMAGSQRQGIQRYRNHRLEVRKDGPERWAVMIHAPDDTPMVVLRNRVPNELGVLMDEARGQVDRRLGVDWRETI